MFKINNIRYTRDELWH